MGGKSSKSSVIFVGLDNSGKTTIINSLKSKGKVSNKYSIGNHSIKKYLEVFG